MCNVGNLRISKASLSKQEKLLHSLALPNIKYNCAILFLSQLYLLFILQNVFSHRPPLYDLFDKAEFTALHTPCTM